MSFYMAAFTVKATRFTESYLITPTRLYCYGLFGLTGDAVINKHNSEEVKK